MIATIQAVRSWRDASGVKPGEFLEARLTGLDGLAPLVARLARLTPVEDDREPVATIPAGGVQVDLLTGVDPAEAAAKVEAERAHLRKEIAIAEKKLANEGFVAKAPEAVVAAQREKLERYRAGAGGARARMTLEDAERLLLSLELFGMRFGLDRMRRLLTVLGSPQERFGAIHVVGTNGKSSTVRMAAAILRRHGLRTGAYLSPHLVSFAERVRVDDADISRRGLRRRRAARGRGRRRRSTARWSPATASRSSSC